MTRIRSKFAWAILIGLSLLALAIASPRQTAAAPGDTAADRVFGQAGSFTSATCNQGLANPGADSLCAPHAGVFDAAGNLYVPDDGNHRVLEYDTPLTTDTVADRVFGQAGSFTSGACSLGGISASSLCNPAGVAVDAAGNLYVADYSNNRVLEYNTPLTTDTVADRVFGQPDFTSGACNQGLANPGASSLCTPTGVTVDAAGNLYVADPGNNRVLEYNTPLTTDTVADRVFGQAGSFTSNTCNLGNGYSGPASASSLCFPNGEAVDAAGNLYVADTSNNRVLEYNTPLTADTVADRVFGQAGSFTTNSCNLGNGNAGPASASSLCIPRGVAVDAAGNLYVAGGNDNRVLEYNTPLTTDTVADRVFGQAGSFTSNTCNLGGVSAVSLCQPYGVTVDAPGNLYVADSNNNRVLEYDTPTPTPTLAGRVFGQGGSFTSGTCNLGGISASSLCQPCCQPWGLAVDAGGNFYVADTINNRVLEYNTPLTTDTVADRVFGQAGSFTSGACNPGFVVSASSLCHPFGVAVDAGGNLYVADSGNRRVLEYNTPLTTDTVADRVFGQGGNFAATDCNLGSANPSASSLCGPHGVVVDAAGNLYVADQGNNRVLEYDTPLTTGTVADRVFGQGGSFTTKDCNPPVGTPGASSLCGPEGAAVDAAGNLYVADFSNARVLEYNTPLTTNTVADRVFGQGGSFTSATCDLGGVSASSLCGPEGVAVDAAGNLYVADNNGNNRVLEYNTPLTTDTVADRVFGQGGSFTSITCNLGGISASSLCNPEGVTVDAAGNLYVGDQNNNRVLEYNSQRVSTIIVQGPASGSVAPGTSGGTFDPSFDLGINKGGEAVFQDTVSGGTATSGIFLFFAGQPVQSLALQGQTAPSTGGAFSTFGPPAINDNGQVAARAPLSGGTASEGLFLFFAGQPAVKLAAQGDPAAGGVGGTFSGFGNPALNNTGQVAARATISGGSASEGLFLFFAGQPAVKLAAQGDPALGGNGTISGFVGDPVINDQGQVAAVANIAGGTASKGLFLFFAGSPATRLGAQGDPALGGTISSFGNPAINFRGQVAAVANITGGAASQGLFLFFAGSPLTRLGAQGDPALGGTISGFSNALINDNGVVVVRATISGGTATEGLFLFFAGSAARQIVAQGDPATGGGTYSGFTAVALNGGAQVVFVANVSGGPASQGVFFASLDVDGDGLLDYQDNCPAVFNPVQNDGDADGAGNACDNCLTVPNAGQADFNHDGIGDACQDSDNDSLGQTTTSASGPCNTGGTVQARFRDCIEVFLGTDPGKACAVTTTANDEAVDPMPADLNDDRSVNVTDRTLLVLAIKNFNYNPAQTLGANVISTDTTITSSGTAIQNGHTIKIDSELMLVTAGGGTTSLTVKRAQNGTAAASHSAGAMINHYQLRYDLNADFAINVTDRTIVALYIKQTGGLPCTP